MAEEALRGSQELLKRLTEPAELDPENLKQLVGSVERVSGRILNWEIYGKPRIEVLRASFAVGPDRLAPLVEQLVQNRARFGWEVFPEGIPPLVDQYRVVIKSGGGL
jgi:hypothetical protein